MFYLIGVGLKPEQLTLEAITALKGCEEVFLEKYTSEFAEGELSQLESLVGQKIRLLDRNQVESEFNSVLASAARKNIALLTIGNPVFATTHIQLLIDAQKLGVQSEVVPGISVQNYLGKTGLDAYKFGRTVSIVFQSENYKPDSFYNYIISNIAAGLHTLCLLDITTVKKMSPREAIKTLIEIENRKGEKRLQESKAVVIAGLGSEQERIVSGRLPKLVWVDFPLPASLIVCGNLNDKEQEGLQELTEVLD